MRVISSDEPNASLVMPPMAMRTRGAAGKSAATPLAAPPGHPMNGVRPLLPPGSSLSAELLRGEHGSRRARREIPVTTAGIGATRAEELAVLLDRSEEHTSELQ